MKKFFQNMDKADIVLSVFWSLVLIASGVCGKIGQGAVNEYTSNKTIQDVEIMKDQVDTLKWKVAAIEKDAKEIPTLRNAVNDLNTSVGELKGVLIGAKIIQIYK